MDEYTEQCKVVRAATEKNDGVSMKEALAQLKYTTSDVDVVELKVNWDRYCKVEKKMQAAIDSGNEAAVKEIVDEWDFADKDPCVEMGRKFLAGELKPPAIITSAFRTTQISNSSV